MYTKFKILTITLALFLTVCCAIGAIATGVGFNGATIGIAACSGYAAFQITRKR
nr:MAG TPA: hypothetical protein [Caudoviricetes sp.]